jgi:AmiR/NasT family two-component response regulator
VVGEADNGADALQLARTLQPDLVIADIMMPEMDGIELSRRRIGRAKRVLIQQLGLSEEEAFRRLQQTAEQTGKPLAEVAEAVLLAYQVQPESES